MVAQDTVGEHNKFWCHKNIVKKIAIATVVILCGVAC